MTGCPAYKEQLQLAYEARKEAKQNKEIRSLKIAQKETQNTIDSTKTTYASITQISKTNQSNITKNTETITNLENKIKQLEEENRTLKTKNAELQKQVEKINHLENKINVLESTNQTTVTNDLPEILMTLSMGLWSLSKQPDEGKTHTKIISYLSALFNRNLDTHKMNEQMAACGFKKRTSSKSANGHPSLCS